MGLERDTYLGLRRLVWFGRAAFSFHASAGVHDGKGLLGTSSKLFLFTRSLTPTRFDLARTQMAHPPEMDLCWYYSFVLKNAIGRTRIANTEEWRRGPGVQITK